MLPVLRIWIEFKFVSRSLVIVTFQLLIPDAALSSSEKLIWEVALVNGIFLTFGKKINSKNFQIVNKTFR